MTCHTKIKNNVQFYLRSKCSLSYFRNARGGFVFRFFRVKISPSLYKRVRSLHILLAILLNKMSVEKERVFVIGASGAIGSGIIRSLVKKEVQTTAFVRDEQKAKELFKEELKTNYLTFVVGNYSSIDVFTKAIQGHTRLFILVAEISKPTSMSQIKGTFGKIAFEQGVRQIVDLSSASVRTSGKDGIIGYIHTTAEEKLWALVDENPEQRSLVVLRPASFMYNQFRGDSYTVKQSNKLVSCGPPSATTTWIDTKGKSTDDAHRIHRWSI